MIKDLAKVAECLEKAVRDFTDKAVIGISGGVDSSLVAGICVKALGKDNVYLVSMPYDEIDLESFNKRSSELAEQLGAKHFVISIKDSVLALQKQLASSFNSELEVLTKANLRPRVRMNILYSVSGELGLTTNKRARVMGTGHLSEDIIGYDTKGGDALCDYFILADLVKSEVYQLAKYYKLPESIINAVPSAGLYPGQTDEEELGYSYAVLEKPTLAIRKLIHQGIAPEKISAKDSVFAGLDPETVNFVVNRYKIHYHKHQAPLNLILRNLELFQD